MGSEYRRAVKARARRLVAEFFDQHYPKDRYPGTEVCEENVGMLDVPFLEYWRVLNTKHSETCRARLHHAECLECDALQRLRPHPVYGTSAALYGRLFQVGRFEALGRMILPLAQVRSQPLPSE